VKRREWKERAKTAERKLAELQAESTPPPVQIGNDGAVTVSRKACHSGDWGQSDQAIVSAALAKGQRVNWTD
jgi:hypothetical protein